MLETADVIVVGGGIAGLAAARGLAAKGSKVVLVEARNRLGGRIFTQRPAHWPEPVDLGAQFVHGGNAELWQLLRAAGTRVAKVSDAHWRSTAGVVSKIANLDEEIASVTGLIDPRKAGKLSFARYFERHPPEVTTDAWMLAQSFVEGFEAAPQDHISARSLSGEAMDEEKQFMIPGGYGQVIAFLAAECLRRRVEILQGTVVRSVEWKRGMVRVETKEASAGARRTLMARAAVITLPLGVLKARAGPGVVAFHPPLTAKRTVIARMGMGAVARMVLRFSKPEWKRILPRVLRLPRPKGFGFIHSVAAGVPVWWSLSDQPVIVGWAGGPRAVALGRMSPLQRKRQALSSLAKVLGLPAHQGTMSKVEMLEWEWSRDPYSRGAYSFTAAGQDEAAEKLARPLAGTLFFAGEATAEGSEVGTVHGALRSGKRAAREIRRATR